MKSHKVATVRRSQKRGLPPGSLVHIGSRFPEQEGFTCHLYDGTNWIRKAGAENCMKKTEKSDQQTVWLEINGLSDINALSPVFEQFSVNALILEDILNTDQNAKSDIGDKWIFFVLKNIDWDEKSMNWSSEQISLVLEPGRIGSFSEKKSDLFNPLYVRLADKNSKVRTHGADFTLYSILDLIVDDYLTICENLELQIENLELGMEGRSDFDPTPTVHQIRKFHIYFRHQVIPVRDGIFKLIREPDHLISPDDLPYYQDILDHIEHILSQLDQIRDNLSSIRELYLSQINMRMNKVIQLLTVVSTIFIPITFIAGIYGMNFRNMPELRSEYGYFIVIGLMFLIGLGSYLFFRLKKWM